jgi:hypothetical protein
MLHKAITAPKIALRFPDDAGRLPQKTIMLFKEAI